jgi:hypothetical protein
MTSQQAEPCLGRLIETILLLSEDSHAAITAITFRPALTCTLASLAHAVL